MNKQTFQIPEGCKSVTVEQVGNQIITTFEPQLKRGDVLITKKGTIGIFKDIFEDKKVEVFAAITKESKIHTETFRPFFMGYLHEQRLATPEEVQLLWDALAKEGKRWNPETMEVEEIKKEIPRANLNCPYYCIDGIFGMFDVARSVEMGHPVDDDRHKAGNYFQTEEQCQRFADKLKQTIDEFWKEELK